MTLQPADRPVRVTNPGAVLVLRFRQDESAAPRAALAPPTHLISIGGIRPPLVLLLLQAPGAGRSSGGPQMSDNETAAPRILLAEDGEVDDPPAADPPDAPSEDPDALPIPRPLLIEV